MIRYWIAITLGKTKDNQVIPHLNQLLEDSHELVRQAAQKSLKKITNHNLKINPLYNHPGVENFGAATALCGMNVSDLLSPNSESSTDKLTVNTTGDHEDNDSDEDEDDLPF